MSNKSKRETAAEKKEQEETKVESFILKLLSSLKESVMLYHQIFNFIF